MPSVDTHDIDSISGAMYFIVGRGSEGGASSYHLAIAGINAQGVHSNWGQVEHVVDNSGYSIGTIQVDLGQRGTWPLGATRDGPLEPGQTTYVDGLIAEAAKYAKENHLKFASDRAQLRSDLLTHGNGEGHRTTLRFIDPDTRDSFNAWGSSDGGKTWIHTNVDYPQIRNASKIAMEMLDSDGRNISEDHRLETLAILAKTANQMPGKLADFQKVLRDGGDYDDVLAKAKDIKRHHRSYAGPEVAALAARYNHARDDVERAAAIDRAQAKVASAHFNPSTASADPDFQEALKAIGHGHAAPILRQGSRGDQVAAVQADLASLGFTDKHGVVLTVDGKFGSDTQAAVRAFQEAHRLTVDGRVGPTTLQVLHQAASQQVSSLHEAGHPGHEMYCQALEGVHAIDALYGRAPDTFSANLAGSLTAAAHGQGLARIDHVILGEGATRAFAVEGNPRSPFRQFAAVDVMQAGATPLAQSSAEFLAASRPEDVRQAQSAQLQPSPAQAPLETMHR